MVVVMPLGYGDLAFLRTHDVWDDPSTIDHNTDLFGKALLTEVLPRVESEYHVSKDRNDRAIAGLSMGGWKVSKSALPTPVSSPGSVASAQLSTISTTPRSWHRSTPKPPTSAFSG